MIVMGVIFYSRNIQFINVHAGHGLGLLFRDKQTDEVRSVLDIGRSVYHFLQYIYRVFHDFRA